MKNYCFTLILLIIFSCKEDQNLPPNNTFVQVKSISSVVLPSGGVTLKGSIKNAELELDYGFMIYLNSNITPNASEIRSSKRITGLHNGDFTITFKNDLYKNQDYYYRAFAYTSNKTILGEEKMFASSGSAQSIITNVSPSIAHIRDTVSVFGKNFSENITLSLNQININPIIVNDSLIKFIVPGYPSDRRYDNFTIRKRTGEEVVYNDFGIHIPELYSISPNPAYDTDTLTITGNHFDIIKEANKVFIGDYGKLEILESSRTVLKVKGPGGFSDFKPRFKIRAQHTEIDVYNKLDIVLPEVTGISKVIKFDTPFTIKGNDFPYVYGCTFGSRYRPWLNKTTFLEPIKCYRDGLIVTLNKVSSLKDFYHNEINTTYFDVENTYNFDYYIDEPIIKVKGYELEDTHVYKNELYAFSNPFNYTNDYVVKFDETEKDFILKDEYKIDDTSVGHSYIKCFYKDNFYYVRYVNGENILFSYNFITKRNTRLKEIPGQGRQKGFIKGFGDYLYFGLGNLNDIWRYSIKDDIWEKFTELAFSDINVFNRNNPLVFFLNNAIYIGGGNIRKNDLYAIDLDSREITKKKSLPFFIESDFANSFIVKENKLLFYNQYFYEYNPDSNEWTILEAFRNANYYNITSFRHMVFYRDEIYGYSGGLYNTGFYKFNNKYF